MTSVQKITINWDNFTDKQEAMIREYIKTGNKLGSYRKVYGTDTIQENTLRRNCYAEFRKPHIAAAIEQIQAVAVEKAGLKFDSFVEDSTDAYLRRFEEDERMLVDAAWVLRKAYLLANFNIRKFLKVDGQGNAVYDFSQATDDDWYCIEEYTVEEIQRGSGDDVYFIDKLKIKTPSKVQALKLLGEHIDVQAFKQKTEVEHSGTIGVTEITREVVDPK